MFEVHCLTWPMQLITLNGCSSMYNIMKWISIEIRKEGPMGLLTGAGKGIAGLITKPTGAIVDLTSAAFTTIQK